MSYHLTTGAKWEQAASAYNDIEIPGIGTPDLSGVSDHEHRDDRGVTVIGGLRLDLRAEYEWLDTSSAFAASGINLLFLIRF